MVGTVLNAINQGDRLHRWCDGSTWCGGRSVSPTWCRSASRSTPRRGSARTLGASERGLGGVGDGRGTTTARARLRIEDGLVRSMEIRGTTESRFGVELPIFQAPMAGAQGSALAIAVCNAGGLGALPCAMLDPAAMRRELAAVRAAPRRRSPSTSSATRRPRPTPSGSGGGASCSRRTTSSSGSIPSRWWRRRLACRSGRRPPTSSTSSSRRW